MERASRIADELAGLGAVIDRDGPMVEGSRGQPTVNPAVAEARQLELVQLRLLAAIHLDPETERAATPAQGRARRAAQLRHAYRREGHVGAPVTRDDPTTAQRRRIRAIDTEAALVARLRHQPLARLGRELVALVHDPETLADRIEQRAKTAG